MVPELHFSFNPMFRELAWPGVGECIRWLSNVIKVVADLSQTGPKVSSDGSRLKLTSVVVPRWSQQVGFCPARDITVCRKAFGPDSELPPVAGPFLEGPLAFLHDLHGLPAPCHMVGLQHP